MNKQIEELESQIASSHAKVPPVADVADESAEAAAIIRPISHTELRFLHLRIASAESVAIVISQQLDHVSERIEAVSQQAAGLFLAMSKADCQFMQARLCLMDSRAVKGQKELLKAAWSFL